MNRNNIIGEHHSFMNGLMTKSNAFKMILSLVGLILTLMIAPLNKSIQQAEERIERIEQTELPAINEEQKMIRIELAEIKTRQENQIEMLRQIAENVEYIRRAREGNYE